MFHLSVGWRIMRDAAKYRAFGPVDRAFHAGGLRMVRQGAETLAAPDGSPDITNNCWPLQLAFQG